MSVNNRLYLHVIMLLLLNSVRNDTFQSLLTRHESGTDFVPPHPVELLATLTSVSTFDACFNYCHQNIRCRTLVSILMSPFSCRLYEGVSDTGTITSSMAPGSRVGSIHYYPELYGKYGQPCNPALPLPDRYMVCQNGVWSCPINTYWDGSLCRNAVYYNGSCKANNQCRQDLGLQCDLLRERCGCNLTVAWNGTSCGKYQVRRIHEVALLPLFEHCHVFHLHSCRWCNQYDLYVWNWLHTTLLWLLQSKLRLARQSCRDKSSTVLCSKRHHSCG